MKKIILTSMLAAAVALSFSSCTTHEYPPTQETTVYVPAPKKKVTKKPVVHTHVNRDTPESTTVVRPEE